MPVMDSNRSLNPLPWLSAQASSAYEWGKGGAGRLFGAGYLRRSAGYLNRSGSWFRRSFGLDPDSIAAPGLFRGLAGKNLRRGAGLMGRWAMGGGYSGLSRVGAAAARLGPLAGAAGLGAWGINRLRD